MCLLLSYRNVYCITLFFMAYYEIHVVLELEYVWNSYFTK